MSPGTPGRERSVWGWGWDDAGPGPEHAARHRPCAAGALRPPARSAETTPPALESLTLPRPRCDPPAVARAALLDRAARPRGAYLRASRSVTWFAACAASSPTRPTSSPIRAPRRTSSPCSTGARASARPPSRTAAARASSAASSRPPRDLHPAVRLARPRPPRPRRSRSIARRAPRASRAASWVRHSRSSSARTGSRCATSRSRSSSPRSAAGSRRAPAVTTPPSTRTSTTSWRRCAWSRRAASSRRAGYPARAPARSPDRLFIGSEGILGVIVEAWMRLQDRPTFRASASVTFAEFSAGAEAARAIAQAGLYPANCRLLDAGEAAVSRAPGPADDSGAPRGVRVGRPSARRLDGARARVRPRSRRSRAGRRGRRPDHRRGRPRRRRRRLAARVPRRAVSPQRDRRPRAW